MYREKPEQREIRRRTGEHTSNWKGGTRVDSSGYLSIKCLEHPAADHEGYVREHRLLMEAKIGRYLQPKEVVHHIDGNRRNNDLGNLRLMTWKEHAELHRQKQLE
jgi:hypothetical protein